MNNANWRRNTPAENNFLGKAILAVLVCVLLFLLLGWWCVPLAALLGLGWAAAELLTALYRRVEVLERRVRALEGGAAPPQKAGQGSTPCRAEQPPQQEDDAPGADGGKEEML